MESIFLSAIDMYGHDYCPENLQVLNSFMFWNEYTNFEYFVILIVVRFDVV